MTVEKITADLTRLVDMIDNSTGPISSHDADVLALALRRIGNDVLSLKSGHIKTTGATWRHRKRGTVYTEVCRGVLQAAHGNEPTDGEIMVVYEGEDGRAWVRASVEFEDGRFEPVGP